jgi:hypothetical protein
MLIYQGKEFEIDSLDKRKLNANTSILIGGV